MSTVDGPQMVSSSEQSLNGRLSDHPVNSKTRGCVAHSIGIMQGRLLPPFEGRFQAFPAAGWRQEFAAAKRAGLSSIEWIYEVPHEADNPLGNDKGIAEMLALSETSNVSVGSLCADYYMDRRLVVDAEPQSEQFNHLKWLLQRADKLALRYIVLPFVDRSSLRSGNDIAALTDALTRLLPDAKRTGVELHLETDLPPDDFAALLSAINHPLLKANYDIGNSASLGFNQEEELRKLAPWLGSVHVKDRVLGGGTVPLGTGNADLPGCFRALSAAGYARLYILQAARGMDGDETSWAQQNREFVERQLDALEA